ncbi:MAG: sigma-70 family RNA polymerase sigma factor [Microthrixaceae bacterium]
MQEPPDWIEVVEAARAGDEHAQASVLTRFTPLLRATASRLIEVDRVDDVVQESLIAALRSLPDLRTPEAFPSLLRLIVRKQASRLRGHGGEVSLDIVDGVDGHEADPADQVERRDVAAVIRVALGAVSDQDRRLLELRYLAGWTNDELADLLGVTNGTIRKRLHDARRRFRPHVEHLNPKEHTMTDYRSYLNAVHDASITIPLADPLRAAGQEPTVTGLKVIDAMAPIRRGGTIEMVGPAGTGHLVVALELAYRIGRTERDVACVAVGRAGAAIGSQADLGCIVTEEGMPGPSAAILTATPDETAHAFDAAARLSAGLAAAGLDVILVVDQPSLEQLNPAALVAAAGLADEGSVTVIAVRALERATDAPSPFGLDTTLVFSIEQFALGIFPAIDPTLSTSTFDITEAGQTIRQRLTEASTLRAWFNQPLFVAQDYTGDSGTWLDPETVQAELADLTR